MIRLLSLCAVIPSSIGCLLFASLFVLSSLWFVSVLLIVGQFFVASFCVFVQFNVLNFVGRDPLHSPDSHQLLIVVTKIRPDQHRKSIKNHCVPENSSEKNYGSIFVVRPPLETLMWTTTTTTTMEERIHIAIEVLLSIVLKYCHHQSIGELVHFFLSHFVSFTILIAARISDNQIIPYSVVVSGFFVLAKPFSHTDPNEFEMMTLSLKSHWQNIKSSERPTNVEKHWPQCNRYFNESKSNRKINLNYEWHDITAHSSRKKGNTWNERERDKKETVYTPLETSATLQMAHWIAYQVSPHNCMCECVFVRLSLRIRNG